MRTRVQLIKKYMRLRKARKLTSELTEQLVMEAGDDSKEMMDLFMFLHHGGKLPADWEKSVSENDPALMNKALPSKDRTGEDKDAKKTSSKKASSKKAGKTGKTRYNYPQDKAKKKSSKQDGPQRASEKFQKEKEESEGADPIAVPKDPVPKSVDPQHMANQLQIPVHTLQHIAKRFKDNPKLKGRKGFVTFMSTKLKSFAEKHKLDGDFFGLLYDALTGAGPTVATSS